MFMGLMKDRHGTYYATKKVPKALQEAVARILDKGKQRQVWLKRSLATKDLSDAKKRIKAAQSAFDRILDQAKGLLGQRPMRSTISDAEIKLIADHHYAQRLHDNDVEKGLGGTLGCVTSLLNLTLLA
jgi:hypothetical protein